MRRMLRKEARERIRRRRIKRNKMMHENQEKQDGIIHKGMCRRRRRRMRRKLRKETCERIRRELLRGIGW